MMTSIDANVYLPSWRQGRLLFFTNTTDNYTTRHTYRVVAATKHGESKVERTYKAPISNENLERCQQTADNGPALQKFFQVMGRGNLDDLVNEDALCLPACGQNVSRLIFICSYLDLLRKYSVDQAIVRNYESSGPRVRFDPDLSLSIYKILSSHLQPERAAALLDADIPNIQSVSGPTKAVANLLREAAIIRYDTGTPDLAIQTMLRAAAFHNTEDKWRRLADFAMAADQTDKAIEFYSNAENLSPLAPPAALRMARLLIGADRIAEAAPFLDRAEEAFKKPVDMLRMKIAEHAN